MIPWGTCVVKYVIVQTVLRMDLVEPSFYSLKKGTKQLPCDGGGVIALVNKITCPLLKRTYLAIIFPTDVLKRVVSLV